MNAEDYEIKSMELIVGYWSFFLLECSEEIQLIIM